MTATRREFLALASAGGLTGSALAFPIPLPRAVAAAPLAPPSDSLPPLPDGAIRRLGSRRLRAGRYISRLQFSPNGKIIVAADRDEIRGWDVATARPVFSMGYPAKADLKAGRVTNRNTLVTLALVEGNPRFEIHHYAYATGEATSKAGTTINRFDTATFNADGSRVAVFSEGKLHLYDGCQTRELWSTAIAGSGQRSPELCLLDAEKLLASTADDGLRIFEVETGKQHEPLKCEPRAKPGRGRGGAAVDCIVASPGGELLAGIGGAQRDRILIWNAPKGELIRSIEVKEPSAFLGFTPDGGTLFVICQAGLQACSVETGKVLRTLDIGPNRSLQLSPDGTLLATSADDAVLFFDALTGKPQALCADPPGLPTKLHYIGPRILVGLLAEYGGWIQWNLDTGSNRLLRPRTLGDGLPLAISDDARIALVWAKDRLHRWDLVSGEELASIPLELNRSVPLADLSRDGRRIVAADAEGLKVWDARSGKPMPLIPAGITRDDADSMAFSADGDTIALTFASRMQNIGTSLQSVEIYSLRAERMLRRFPLSGVGATPMSVLSHDGTRLATSANDGGNSQNLIAIYDTRSGGLLSRINTTNNRSNRFQHFAISPDNRLVALATEDLRLELWEILSGHRRLKFKLPGDATSMAFAPDSGTLAVASPGGPVLIWDLRRRSGTKPAKPDAASCAKLMDWLGGKDGNTAYEALRLVAAWPEETLPLLRESIPAVKPPDAAKLKEWIGNLDAPAYSEREKATRALIDLGELAAPALNATLAETGSAEVRARAEAILSRCGGTAADWKTARAVEAAEWAATPKAKQILKSWADGAAGAKLTNEAKAALRRLGS